MVVATSSRNSLTGSPAKLSAQLDARAVHFSLYLNEKGNQQ